MGFTIPSPFHGCPFTYPSLILGLAYLGLFCFTIWLLSQLMKLKKTRMPQKCFLFLLSIHSSLRSLYFIIWPFIGNSCIPGLKKSTNLYYLEVLGTIPVVFFLLSFSVFVVVVARVRNIFQLYFNRGSPSCIILFYRILVAVVIIINLASITFTIADILTPDEAKLKVVTINGALTSITLGSLVIGIAFVYVVVTLYGTIEDEIIKPLRIQDEQLARKRLHNDMMLGGDPNGIAMGSFDPNHPTSTHGGGNGGDPFGYTYDGDENGMGDGGSGVNSSHHPNSLLFNPSSPSTNGNGNRYHTFNHHPPSSPSDPMLLHSSISSTFGQSTLLDPQTNTSSFQLTPQQTQSFSFGYSGRLALNPHRNPMRHLYIVSIVSFLSLCAKAGLLVLLNYFIEFDEDTDGHGFKATALLALYFLVSELVPSIACLISFNVVAAPTSQWKYTYTGDSSNDIKQATTNNHHNQNNTTYDKKSNNSYSDLLLQPPDDEKVMLGSINHHQPPESAILRGRTSNSGRSTMGSNHHTPEETRDGPLGYHKTIGSLKQIRQQQQQEQQQQQQQLSQSYEQQQQPQQNKPTTNQFANFTPSSIPTSPTAPLAAPHSPMKRAQPQQGYGISPDNNGDAVFLHMGSAGGVTPTTNISHISNATMATPIPTSTTTTTATTTTITPTTSQMANTPNGNDNHHDGNNTKTPRQLSSPVPTYTIGLNLHDSSLFSQQFGSMSDLNNTFRSPGRRRTGK